MPWWNILSNGATIVDVARQIYNTVKKDQTSNQHAPNSGNNELAQRIEFLEKNEMRQAELIKSMAEQLNVLIKKTQTAYILAIIATIVATFSIVLQLLQK